MNPALNIIQIVLSVAIVIIILFQVKGGGLGGIFGQADSVYRTRRGIEKTLFQLTVILVVIFIIISIVSLRMA